MVKRERKEREEEEEGDDFLFQFHEAFGVSRILLTFERLSVE